jgi:cell division septation protein DedD
VLKKLLVLGLMVSIAACARRQPPPEPEFAPAPPVEISEEPEPAPTPPPPVEEPPPPDTPAKPLQTDTGRFRIAIASLDSAELTAKWVSKAEAAGYRTEVLAVAIDGKTWHRVLLPGYESLADAQAALPFIQQELSPSAWVTSRRRAPTPDGAGDAPPPPAEAPPPPEQPAS